MVMHPHESYAISAYFDWDQEAAGSNPVTPTIIKPITIKVMGFIVYSDKIIPNLKLKFIVGNPQCIPNNNQTFTLYNH